MPLSYADAIQVLYGLSLFGAELGLETTRRLASLAGNPQDQLRFIHVAGTNGKGSTCAMLESIYRQAGFRVGLFTSPHLVCFRERLQLNRTLISQETVVRLVAHLQSLIKELPADVHPTFFEVVTVMALCHFAEQKCDLVLWETGLGGRLDATNIVVPLASVITNIELDHEQWLGSTLEQIAREKAGIIKKNVPVLTATTQPGPLEIIRQVAATQNAPLVHVTQASLRSPPISQLNLPLPGQHQKMNAALALATTRLLNSLFPIPESTALTGLESVLWPGRGQFLTLKPGRALLLDAAHNPSGAEALRTTLLEQFPAAPKTLVLGMFQDKDCRSICQILAPLADCILVAPIGSERSANPSDLAAYCRQANPQASVRTCPSLPNALSQMGDAPFVILTGSAHFVGEAMELLHLVDPLPNNERALNEWKAVTTSTP